MHYTKEQKGIIWLSACSGLSYGDQIAALREARDPAKILTHWNEICQNLIKEGKTRVYKTRESIAKEVERVISELERIDAFAITFIDDDYPHNFEKLSDRPFVIYGMGNRELLKRKMFAIVGSRTTPAWAEKHAKTVSSELSEHFVILTGFAEVGDRAAVDGALASGNLVCVLPLGLDLCYPAAHASLKEQVKRKGLLISEYPPGTALRKHHFHARNRFFAVLAEGVLFVSGRKDRGGTSITANYAAHYGQKVFAFPYNLGVEAGSGCLDLLQMGAILTTCAEDVLIVYGKEAKKKVEIPLSEQERAVLQTLRECGELHSALLADKLGIPLPQAVAILSALEMKNLAVKAGGNRYSAI